VLKYLARYTHRVAISNQRLVSIDNGQVAFRWKDYAQASRQRTMVLDALEFIRRFLLHVLPKGFVRIRYYGFLANAQRNKKLARIRELLTQNHDPPLATPPPSDPEPTGGGGTGDDAERCHRCRQGSMILVEEISPTNHPTSKPWWADTS